MIEIDGRVELEKDDIAHAYITLQEQTKIYNENKEYVKGKNPKTLRQKRRKDPDNRIPVPLAKSAVTDMAGYAGSDIRMTYEGINEVDEGKLDEYKMLMREFEDHNDDDIITSRLYKESLSHIETYLIMWTSDDLALDSGMVTPEYTVVGMDQVVIIWDDKLKPEKIAGCYFVQHESNGEKEIICTVYYPGYSEKWTGNGSDWKKVDEINEYPFTKVPIVVFQMSLDGGPLFQAEKPLIDSHDSVLSKGQNEVDRYNALVLLLPELADPEFVKKLEEHKVIDNLGSSERWPEYLEKNLSGVTDYVNRHMDRLERLFHKTIKVVDFNQITAQGGDESGVARAFKLLGMEFLASEIEKVFIKGFYERQQLLNDIIAASTMSLPLEDFTMRVDMKRNLPIDELSKVNIATALKGLGVSNETILKILPNTLIPEPEKEAELMRKADDRRTENFQNMLNGNNDADSIS